MWGKENKNSAGAMTKKDIKFFIILLFLMILNIIDALATAFWIENNLASEANPVMQTWLDISPTFFIVMKIFLVSVCGALLWKLRHRKLTYILLTPVLIIYTYIFFKHVSIAYMAFRLQ